MKPPKTLYSLLIFIFSCFFAGNGLFFLLTLYPNKKKFYSESITKGTHQNTASPLTDSKTLSFTYMQGVTLQNEQKYKEAEQCFSRVHQEFSKQKLPSALSLQKEVLARRIINTFCLNQTCDLEKLVNIFTRDFPQSSFKPLFTAFVLSQKTLYQEALEQILLWEQAKPKQKELLEEQILSEKLVDDIKDYLKARCYIETHSHSIGRLILNKKIQETVKNDSLWSTEKYDALMLLMARSYLLEATKAKSNRINYYETVLFYLSKLNSLQKPIFSTFIPTELLLNLLLGDLPSFPPEKLTILIKLLEVWKQNSLSADSHLLVSLIEQSFEEENISNLCVFLSLLSQSEPFASCKAELISNLTNNLSLNIQNSAILQAKKTLSLIHKLDGNLSLSSKLVLSEEALQQLILENDSQNTKLKNYLSLWEEIQPHNIDHQALVNTLVSLAKTLWNQNNDEKALTLLSELLKFTHYDIKCESAVLLFVKKAYAQAESSHEIERLLKLEDFVLKGHLPFRSSLSEEKLINFFADAEYLFSHGLYAKSALYCRWLIRVSPSTHFYRLLGLCLTKQKEYQQALECFNHLPPKEKINDTKVLKALTICQNHLTHDLLLGYKKSLNQKSSNELISN
ncbi:DUF1347 family protein [Chlamydiifrater phoenicopteri]|uniref:DUF1347 family protein n=1 Tax=Chlamydiifrater phoenicopteri TaxID=2681469 RepID=UPI001BCDB27D|nr:DUF1347 family protein [Chlamydiifrater phoenicopteri]